MNDLRELIRQVQRKGGPLYLMDAADDIEWVGVAGHPVAFVLSSDYDLDSLAGVLRRDMVSRGLLVWHSHGGDKDDHIVSWNDPPAEDVWLDDTCCRGEDVLTAHLRAWLDAAEKLGWGDA